MTYNTQRAFLTSCSGRAFGSSWSRRALRVSTGTVLVVLHPMMVWTYFRSRYPGFQALVLA